MSDFNPADGRRLMERWNNYTSTASVFECAAEHEWLPSSRDQKRKAGPK